MRDPRYKVFLSHSSRDKGIADLIGRYIELELDARDPEEARQQGDEMCRKLLANTVIENYRIDVEQ